MNGPHETSLPRAHLPDAGTAGGRPFVIAHLSDPHLSREYYREHLKSFKILLRAILDEGIDHLVITGDIVSTADPNDYFLAREILGANGLLDPNRLTIVPGNHDLFGGPHRAVEVLSFPRHIRTIDYERGLALFEEAFAETFRNVRRIGKGLYPFVKPVGGVALIGLNSIAPWSLWDNPLGSNGRVSENQFDALGGDDLRPLIEGRIPIVAMHHHFNDLHDSSTDVSWWQKVESRTMRLRGRRRTLRLFSSLGVRAVLHGHIHLNQVYERQGIVLSNAGGAVCDDPSPWLKFNRIGFSGAAIDIQVNSIGIRYQSAASSVSIHRFQAAAPSPEHPLHASAQA